MPTPISPSGPTFAPHAVKRPRYRLLDLLRLVAALGVVLFHYTARFNSAWGPTPVIEHFAPLSSITAYGLLGVELFFLISGFVIMMSAWGADVPAFVASRVSRLYPAYWFGVIVTGALLFFDRSITVGGSWDTTHLSGWLVNLTMLQWPMRVPDIDGVYWTLWVELKFYLFIGLFIVIGITRRRILAVAFLWPLVSALFAQFNVPLLNEIFMPLFAPFFAGGMVLYLIRSEGWSIANGLVLGLNAIFAVRYAFTDYGNWVTGNTGLVGDSYVVAAIFLISFAALILATGSRASRLEWRWLTVAGSLTFPLYLVHEVWGWWIISKLYPVVPAGILLPGVVISMLLVAYLIARFIERPVVPRLRKAMDRALRRPALQTTVTPPQSVAVEEAGEAGPLLPTALAKH